MLINDRRPGRQIYDREGYKETRDNAAASHPCSYKRCGRVGLKFGRGHGDDDEDGGLDVEVE